MDSPIVPCPLPSPPVSDCQVTVKEYLRNAENTLAYNDHLFKLFKARQRRVDEQYRQRRQQLNREYTAKQAEIAEEEENWGRYHAQVRALRLGHSESIALGPDNAAARPLDPTRVLQRDKVDDRGRTLWSCQGKLYYISCIKGCAHGLGFQSFADAEGHWRRFHREEKPPCSLNLVSQEQIEMYEKRSSKHLAGVPAPKCPYCDHRPHQYPQSFCDHLRSHSCVLPRQFDGVLLTRKNSTQWTTQKGRVPVDLENPTPLASTALLTGAPQSTAARAVGRPRRVPVKREIATDANAIVDLTADAEDDDDKMCRKRPKLAPS